ncbi:MAG: type transport system permease protein [Actinomycetota bacterium]|nr:type transport system permease protein [Actinomycetota bacterium]
MVEQLLRLKLRLLGNAFRRSPWRVVGLVLGLASGLGIAIVAFTALVGARLLDPGVAAPPVEVFGTIVVLGFVIVPLVFGVDDILDPRRFSLFGISTSRLATALAISALLGIPAISLTLISLGQVVTWTRNPLSIVLAVVAVPVIVATCLLASRVSTGVAAFVLSSRRSRDSAGLLGFVALALFFIVFIAFRNANWQQNAGAILAGTARVASWTPFGAVWAAPADAAQGELGLALVRELIALVFLGLLWLAWRTLVKYMLVTQPRSAEARSYHGLGLFRVLPVSPASVIAERSFTYWIRDARYHASLLVIPIIPFVLMLPLLVIGIPGNILALMPVPIMALFLGWSVHNDTAHDHTAIWLHIVSGTSGRSDRIGRIVPPLVVGLPLLVIASIICAPIYGDEGILPALLGVGLGVLLTGLGLSSIGSAQFPYPAVRPGDSPFAAPQSVATMSALIQGLSFFVTIVLMSPAFVFAALALFIPSYWAWASLLYGLVFGALFLWLGISWGGRIFDRRSPEILGASMRN